MLTHTMQKKYAPTKKSEKIRPALDYIAKNNNTDIKNDDLARITGLSTVYFRKLFTEVMGISPIAYINDIKIKKPRKCLKVIMAVLLI